MKRMLSVITLLLLALSFAVAQTREDIRVYIPPVLAQDPYHSRFFQENFAMELRGAGYTGAGSYADCDYILNLEVKPNMILYDDGTSEQASIDEKQFVLLISLVRNADKIEVVCFSYLFDTTDEMHEFNLYLLYAAMANVPISRITTVTDDNWRNKWFYIRFSFDYPITFYQLLSINYLYGPDPGNPGTNIFRPIDHRISPYPAATIGIELQYLNWMSVEFNFNLSFSDPMSNAFIPAIQIEQKFPIKPSNHFMLEPYAAISFPLNTSIRALHFPRMGVGGGFQLGVKAGSSGAVFVDVNCLYFLGDVIMRNEDAIYINPHEIHYSRYVIGFGIGFKTGFFNRPRR